MQQRLRQIDSLSALISALKDANNEQRVTLISQAVIDLADLRQYYYQCEQSYTRNLIFNCDEFEVILMCWGVGHQSVVHNHNDSLCVMKCLSGQLQEQRYLTPPDANSHSTLKRNSIIQPSTLNHLSENATLAITDDDGLHQLMNRSQAVASSLHFYFPPIHQAKVYDMNAMSAKVLSSRFTSEYGVKC